MDQDTNQALLDFVIAIIIFVYENLPAGKRQTYQKELHGLTYK